LDIIFYVSREQWYICFGLNLGKNVSNIKLPKLESRLRKLLQANTFLKYNILFELMHDEITNDSKYKRISIIKTVMWNK